MNAKVSRSNCRKVNKSSHLGLLLYSQNEYITFTTYLRKHPSGIGLKLLNVDGCAVVKAVSDQLIAQIKDRIQVNDIIISVNSFDLTNASFEKIVETLRWRDGKNGEISESFEGDGIRVPASLSIIEDVVTVKFARKRTDCPTLSSSSRPHRESSITVTPLFTKFSPPSAELVPITRKPIQKSLPVNIDLFEYNGLDQNTHASLASSCDAGDGCSLTLANMKPSFVIPPESATLINEFRVAKKPRHPTEPQAREDFLFRPNTSVGPAFDPAVPCLEYLSTSTRLDEEINVTRATKANNAKAPHGLPLVATMALAISLSPQLPPHPQKSSPANMSPSALSTDADGIIFPTTGAETVPFPVPAEVNSDMNISSQRTGQPPVPYQALLNKCLPLPQQMGRRPPANQPRFRPKITAAGATTVTSSIATSSSTLP